MTLKAQFDRIAIERELCRRSLAEFARRSWHVLEPNSPLKWGWALDVLCEHLEAISRGEITRLVANVPPGCMKSLLIAVIWPAWEWGPGGMPHLRQLGVSHAHPLAIRDSLKQRQLVSSEWYAARWGDTVQLSTDQASKVNFGTTARGYRAACPMGSTTGHRGDRVFVDDPLSVDQALSSAALASASATFREAIQTRTNNGDSAILLIMQRLAVGDPTDIALELGYQHLCLPMEYEVGRSKWVVGKGDPRTTEGELLFPERFGPVEVARLKKALASHGTAGQLQQRPAPRGGGLIKTDCFGKIRRRALPPMRRRAIFVDTAQKAGEENDFSVFMHSALGVDNKLYVLDILRKRMTSPELDRAARRVWRDWKGQWVDESLCIGMYIEDKVSGTGLIQGLKETGGIPVVPVPRTRGGGGKVSRVLDTLPSLEAGDIILVTDEPYDEPWVDEFVTECSLFTTNDTHPYDDQIDCLSDAVSILLLQQYDALHQDWD